MTIRVMIFFIVCMMDAENRFIRAVWKNNTITWERMAMKIIGYKSDWRLCNNRYIELKLTQSSYLEYYRPA
eukprot:TRINITY_DN550_c0_g1_i1.p2 TRINITY_DN550_c0_g1~~TRINITY_DN550_c0_g1_i1.p2  ORF type:complete len:71 (-),score=6.51 TRINITY_DN550_c0_g1_i1:241-453(-)